MSAWRFKGEEDLVCHTHTGEKPFVCMWCCFCTKVGVKPFECEWCDKEFVQELKKYKRIHTEEKPFGCEDCNKSNNLTASIPVKSPILAKNVANASVTWGDINSPTFTASSCCTPNSKWCNTWLSI